jgi:hypothetical protein
LRFGINLKLKMVYTTTKECLMKPLEGKNLVKVEEITLNHLKNKAQAKHMLSIWKLKLKIEL